MVLVQFLINQDNNGSWHNLNINGPCSARLISYVFKHANTHFIQLVSDVFKTPYSASSFQNLNTSRGVIVSNDNFFAFDQSHRDYQWNNIVIPGRVQFSVIDIEAAGQPLLDGNFTIILNFDIEELP